MPIVAALAGMVAAVLADVAAARLGLRRTTAYGLSHVGGLGVTLAASLLGGFAPSDLEQAAQVVLALLLFVTWWFIFFLNFVQAFQSSLRVRILNLIHESGGRMPKSLLEQHYNDRSLLELRLQRLLAQGFVIERDGRLYVVSGLLRLVAAFFRTLKVVLLGRRSEFDSVDSYPSR